MSLIPKFFMEAVLSIGSRDDAGKVFWDATGFLVEKQVNDGKSLVVLITNRHVLDGEKSAVIRLKDTQTGKLKELDLPLEDENKNRLYSVHPDPNVDIAAKLIKARGLEEHNLKLSRFDLDEQALASEKFIEKGGDGGALVYMLGFPMGFVEVDTNTTICRMGCVARMDPAEISKSKRFLLDIQNFPGNSGSPVISMPEAISLVGTNALDKAYLIGIVSGYRPYQEQLLNLQTHRIVEIKSENSGIAVANPVEFIQETVLMELERVFGHDYLKNLQQK